MADEIDNCGGDKLANQLLTSLTVGKEFKLPDVNLDDDNFKIPENIGDLHGEVARLTNEDLTTRQVAGSGVFDALMDSIHVHLKKEYEGGRIAGAEYTKAYIGVVGGALGTAVQFLLGRDQAYWSALLTQQQARAAEIAVVTARVGLETAKATLAAARYQALTAEADYGLTKMRIATEDANFCMIKAQTQGVELDLVTKEFTNSYILPAQRDLLLEQIEVQRAQTADERTDGTPISGSVGKQKELYSQQITSYQRDAEVKASKLFTDAWITMKTIDEGLTAPDGFTNSSIDQILTTLKANNDLS